ncbi:MAG: hypothetical protein O6766_07030 [Gammaproteobacteria bacterium]|nr:hypothetical protein [Gammaproteobacteria bacterium]
MPEPDLPTVKMNLIRPTKPATARVISNELCTRGKSASFVKHLVLDVSTTPLAGNFHAGQSFGVITPGTAPNGKAHKVRLYSVASPTWGEDGAGNVVSTTPKRLIEEFVQQSAKDDPDDHRLFLGVASNYLCDLRAGDEVQITGPNGKRFLLPVDPQAHDYLFLATGTGIAPFRGMLLELLEAQAGPTSSRIDLIMGTPYTTDLLYDELFQQLAEKHANFHYHTAISRELQTTGERGLYVDGLIDRQIEYFADLIGNARTIVYVCGLDGMRYGLFRTLIKHDLAEDYLVVNASLQSRPVSEWSDRELKKGVKPTSRCLLEVY